MALKKSYYKKQVELNLSPAAKKFAKYLVKKDPTLKSKDVPGALDSVRRFVRVVQRINTEPQVYQRFVYTQGSRKLVRELSYEEFLKLKGKKKNVGLVEAFRHLEKIYDN